MERIILSVIVTTFNRPERLRECVSSVVQEFTEQDRKQFGMASWELVIIDDGNFSGFILTEFSAVSGNIKYYKNKFNEGANSCRLKGAMMAKGEFVVFLDDDDLWRSGRLLELYYFHKHVNSDCHFAKYQVSGSIKSEIIRRFTDSISSRNILYRNHIGGFSIFSIRRSVLLNNLNSLNEKLPSCQDWFLFINIFNDSSISKTFGKKSTVEYRVHKSGNITSSLIKRYYGLISIQNLLKRIDSKGKSRFFVLSELLLLRIRIHGLSASPYACFIFRNGSFFDVVRLLLHMLK